ncbi:Avirulence protein (Avh) [Phytophthora palmivora]|uniref:Avirulence protein (Avh) n=1 Tax=Phytophthora palmivora TaxID=4796 RepID=A0A2P4Y5A3_9STRA|nr:Avirulence protein (Avh) [Phytophthora palmivora]
MHHIYFFQLIVITIVGCYIDQHNAEEIVATINLDVNQDRTNDGSVHRTLRDNVVLERSAGVAAIEERLTIPGFSKLKSLFGKNINSVKTLDNNPALVQVMQKNPQLSKQVEYLQQNTGLMQRLIKEPKITQLTKQLHKNPTIERQITNIGMTAAKTTSRGAGGANSRFWSHHQPPRDIATVTKYYTPNGWLNKGSAQQQIDILWGEDALGK